MVFSSLRVTFGSFILLLQLIEHCITKNHYSEPRLIAPIADIELASIKRCLHFNILNTLLPTQVAL
jgi:hypothetical protein